MKQCKKEEGQDLSFNSIYTPFTNKFINSDIMLSAHFSLATWIYLSSVFFAMSLSSAFLQPLGKHSSARPGLGVTQDIERPPTFLDERGNDGDLNVLFIEDSDNEESETAEPKEKGAGRRRWENLNPKIKQRLIEKGQEKAVTNKKKREPAMDKKRREYLNGISE